MKVKQGYMIHRKDGRWETRVYLNGKEKTTACRKKQKDAIRIHNEYIAKLKKPKPILLPQKMTLQKWMIEWYETYKKDKIKSHKIIYNIINKHILPNSTKIDINDVTNLYTIKLLDKIKSERQRRYAYTILHDCLHRAYQDRLINFDVATTLTRPQYKAQEGKVITQQEINKAIQLLPKEYAEAIKMYLATGCRARELFTIKKEDIDIEQKTIHIHGTKTEKSDRIIPIFADIEPLLKELLKTDRENLLQCNYESLKTALRRLKEKHSIDINIKDLRTTFGTMLAEQGIARHIIAKWMGHTSVNTTYKYYIKSTDEFEKTEAQKVTINPNNNSHE